MEGSLSKWTNVMKGWQYRWFVLDDNAGLLSYYTSKEKMTRGVRRGCVRLRAAVIGIDDEDNSTFTITVDHKTFHFQARDFGERERWVRALEETISRHCRRDKWTRASVAQQQEGDIERRIAEADSYLQIMIDLTQKVTARITGLSLEGEQKVQGQLIIDQANSMLDNIKHSIVLLQIAKVSLKYREETPSRKKRKDKNTVNPINGLYQGPLSMQQSKQDSLDAVEYGSECSERVATPNRQLQAMALLVPETSYSSSEGEDDFFDADSGPSILEQSGGSRVESGANSDGSPDLPRTDSGEIDYDALYEESSDNELGSMEIHGSVVSHLLSQVKIGMDLTKVVLPTFILERRSLLEMYADYFAHPDQFLRILEMATPKERMLQVVRWYLSSYHSGRKSTVAKKPYNPILGEVFRCHWDLDSAAVQPNEDRKLGEGPLPDCSPDQLTFVAEQVSHHPPISAFYAEHYNKRIQFEAWVWTKSKFLGISIGVHNIGKGVVTLLDLNEEYTLTFPNGYGRSILTVPWVELGGTVTVECPQTGCRANIEFHTKPFYGGKRNRVSAELYTNGEKKPYLTASGEWSSKMDCVWTDTGKTEVLFDVKNMKARRKRVTPVALEAENESRRVWRHVTAALHAYDVDAATRHKHQVEQAQREAAAERTQPWQTQLFAPLPEEGWEYIEPLKQRLDKRKSRVINKDVNE